MSAQVRPARCGNGARRADTGGEAGGGWRRRVRREARTLSTTSGSRSCGAWSGCPPVPNAAATPGAVKNPTYTSISLIKRCAAAYLGRQHDA
jgi:hypothetical protein